MTWLQEDAAFEAWGAGDLRKAFELFRAAGMQAEPSAYLDLGYFHDEGLGTPCSKHDAMAWSIKAYRQGGCSAASNIAILHRERGNHRAMFRWFELSARLGDGDALVDLARCLRDGLGTPRSRPRAIAAARQAARSSHITSCGREEADAVLATLGFARSRAA